jgi:hypothetical protein
MTVDIPTVHRLHALLNACAHGDRVSFKRKDGTAGIVAKATGIVYASEYDTDLLTAHLTAVDDAGDTYSWSITSVLDGYDRGTFTTYSPEAF